MFTGIGKYYCICEKTSYKVFCVSRGSCAKSKELSQVMSLGSTLVGAEDKFENDKKSGGCGVRKTRR